MSPEFHIKPRNRRQWRRIGFRLLILGLVLIIALTVLDLKLRPTVLTVAEYRAKSTAAQAINTAVIDLLSDENVSYEDLVILTRGSDGRITSIETNSTKVNLFKQKTGRAVAENFERLKSQKLSIPTGALLNLHLLYSLGPQMKLSITPMGVCSTQLLSSFESAGVNQTMHRIELEVSMEFAYAVPLYHASSSVSTRVIVAETVIVGDIPGSYGQIVLDGNNTLYPGGLTSVPQL